jgi:hypothetical protein
MKIFTKKVDGLHNVLSDPKGNWATCHDCEPGKEVSSDGEIPTQTGSRLQIEVANQNGK